MHDSYSVKGTDATGDFYYIICYECGMRSPWMETEKQAESTWEYFEHLNSDAMERCQLKTILEQPQNLELKKASNELYKKLADNIKDPDPEITAALDQGFWDLI